jgi:hypothetical protein
VETLITTSAYRAFSPPAADLLGVLWKTSLADPFAGRDSWRGLHGE